MKRFLIILVTLFVVCATSAAYILSGSYNVAAKAPHWKVTVWFLNLVRERSVAAHSKGIDLANLKSPDLAEKGFPHYHAMCRLCHGAPGYPADEFAKGLNPQPPDLASRDIQALEDRELYWVTRNGIKMTGVPAFSYTHTEEEILGTIAFLRRLPEMTPEEYKSLIRAAGMREEEIPHHRH